MINQKNKAKSRVGCFGASDTHFIMGNWNTSTFMNWWLTKTGIRVNNFSNDALLAGTYKEHIIARWYEREHNVKLTLDRKVKVRKYRLVVNLDAETKDEIIEIKTFKKTDKQWVVPKPYWEQVQVQMFATNKTKAKIVAYGLVEEDYDNFFLEIDKQRIQEQKIDFDKQWVVQEYLPRLVFLAKCMKKHETPNYEEFLKEKK